MVRIYSYEAGKTLESHESILRKLAKKGAKKVNSPEKRDATIIFCPIVSRFETDINTALEAASSEIPDLEHRKVIVVAMHHTFDPNYTLPNSRHTSRGVTLLVDCLFYEKKGFLVCSQNKMAVKKVCKELGLKSGGCLTVKMKINT
ncbi:uncharacterized protein LOC103481128 [Lates japonicus]